jgi:hypothetical protein
LRRMRHRRAALKARVGLGVMVTNLLGEVNA